MFNLTFKIDFYFWDKFYSTPVIPNENLQDGLNIIIEEMSDKPGPNTIIEYFINQWCNAKQSKQSPKIWNVHLETRKTNNMSESNHTEMTVTIPRHHPTCERLGEYWKNQDAITCNLFQKLKNNTLLKPTHHSSNTQKEFNTQLETCHVEFKDLKEITFAEYFDKVCNLILGRYDSCNDLGSRS